MKEMKVKITRLIQNEDHVKHKSPVKIKLKIKSYINSQMKEMKVEISI